MSDQSARLGLPYILPAQAQKHVTHNEAIERLDMLVQLVVEDSAAETPPAVVEPGQVWGLGAAPTGDWAGRALHLAYATQSGWRFEQPQAGWMAYDRTAAQVMAFDGSAWQMQGTPVLDNLEGLGINAGFDATNRLAVAAPATLLSHDGAGHQLKINKAASGDTGTLLFQTGWSGRAEMGLAGDDDFRLKVSADGSAWQTGLVIDRTTGTVSFPSRLVPNPMRAYVATQTAQTCETGQNVHVNYELLEYDTDGFYDPAAPDRLTIPEAGGYLLQAYLQVSAALTPGQGYLIIERYNAAGTKIGDYPASWITGYTALSTPMIQCDAGDYFRLLARQNSGSARTLLTADRRNFLSVARMF